MIKAQILLRIVNWHITLSGVPELLGQDLRPFSSYKLCNVLLVSRLSSLGVSEYESKSRSQHDSWGWNTTRELVQQQSQQKLNNNRPEHFLSSAQSQLRVTSPFEQSGCSLQCSSQNYQPHVPEEHRTWSYRRALVMEYLLGMDADVVCIQEASAETFESDFSFMKDAG